MSSASYQSKLQQLVTIADKNKNAESNLTNPCCIKYQTIGDKSVKIWLCSLCNKRFTHQYTLMRHIPTHTNERRFQCNVCGKAFRQMSTLSQHRAIHSQARPYVCELCPKTFNRISTLISHRKTHTDAKAHQCPICAKSFHQKGNLRNHIFTHTNERPYRCDECDRGFNQMSNLVCHKTKTHQGVGAAVDDGVGADVKQHLCQVCGRGFARRATLRNHEINVHGATDATDNHHQALSKGFNGVSVTEFSSQQNVIYVDPINTKAMQLAVESNKTPLALLRPLNSIPVLVKVLPAPGNKQMLVPANAYDLKRFGEISIVPKTEPNTMDFVRTTTSGDNINREAQQLQIATSSNANNTNNNKNGLGRTIKIKVPVVATVIQRCNDIVGQSTSSLDSTESTNCATSISAEEVVTQTVMDVVNNNCNNTFQRIEDLHVDDDIISNCIGEIEVVTSNSSFTLELSNDKIDTCTVE